MTDEEFWALHRYFITADLMRQRFQEVLHPDLKEGSTEFLKAQAYLHLWYAALFVVIEGATEELKIEDPPFGNLYDFEKKEWKVELLKKLKRYRNAVFHYQKDYLSSKFDDLYNEEDAAAWMRVIHESISDYFKKEMPNRKDYRVYEQGPRQSE